ncbi:hypothetical protein CLOP_g733 [Closterium sp. NIES-67]|nr:hypothetical protein CLOP_g733 [Closterium sp. NIES-67]
MVYSRNTTDAASFSKAWSRDEDAVLLCHALHCGTRRWGELTTSGKLRRNNKSCCNRYIFLRRRFSQHLQPHLWKENNQRSACLLPSPLEGQNQLLRHAQPQPRQQQQQQQQLHRTHQLGCVGSPGSPWPGLAFGGLSFEECKSVFLSPNACRPTAQAHPSSDFSPAAPSDAAVFIPAAPSNAAAFSPVSVSHAAVVSPAAASQAASISAAAAVSRATAEFDAVMSASICATPAVRSLPLKRPREDCTGLLADQPLRGEVNDGLPQCMMQRSHSLENYCAQQRGERSRQRGVRPCMGWEGARVDGLLLGKHAVGHRQLQDWECSSVQAATWPRVGSENALPDDVLLGFRCEDSGFSQRAALSAPLLTQPRAPLSAPLPTQMPAMMSAPLPTHPRAPLSAPLSTQMPAMLTAPLRSQLPAPAGSVSGCIGGSASTGGLVLSHAIAVCNMLGYCSLPLCTPAAHLWLHGSLPAPHLPVVSLPSTLAPCSLSRLPLASVPHGQALPAPVAGAVVIEWAQEQGGTGEGVGQSHSHRQQLSVRQCVQHAHTPSPAECLSHPPRPQPLSEALLLPPCCQQPVAPVFPNTSPPSARPIPSDPRNSHMRAPMPPALPPMLPGSGLRQEQSITSPIPIHQAIAPSPCLIHTCGFDTASLEALLDHVNSHVQSAASPVQLGGTTDLKLENDWELDVFDHSNVSSHVLMLPSGMPDSKP